MAKLWLPYADNDGPLDLSKPTIKEEPGNGYEPCPLPYSPGSTVWPAMLSPVSSRREETPRIPEYWSYGTERPQYSPASVPEQDRHAGYTMPALPYAAAGTVSAASMEAVSWSAPLSPPTSPELQAAAVTAGQQDDALLNDPRYLAFERCALSALAARQGGTLLGSNPRMRRAVRGSAAAAAGEQYRQQRARNNAAAKQSRDRRKLRELKLQLQAAFLKRELQELRAKAVSGALCPRCNYH